jgi:hypothetical protein
MRARSAVVTNIDSIAGLRVGDVREALSTYLNFDHEVLAKVYGNVVGEDVELLNFIKLWKLDG